jgi:hypothetical protein
VSGGLTHGTPGAYNSGCHCDECREAHRRRCNASHDNRLRRTRENGGVAPIAKHDRNTYNNWGCCCTVCIAAQSAYMRDYKASVRAAL